MSPQDLASLLSLGGLLVSVAFTGLGYGLASRTKHLAAKPWLVACSVFLMIVIPGRALLELAMTSGILRWNHAMPFYEVLGVMEGFQYACLGVFLLCLWSFGTVRLDPWNLLFSTKGRIPRVLLWAGLVMVEMVSWRVVRLVFNLGEIDDLRPIVFPVAALLGLLFAYVRVALFVKRLHDADRSGWWLFIALVPILGPLLLLGYCGFAHGTAGPNRFGTDPLNTQEGSAAESVDGVTPDPRSRVGQPAT